MNCEIICENFEPVLVSFLPDCILSNIATKSDSSLLAMGVILILLQWEIARNLRINCISIFRLLLVKDPRRPFKREKPKGGNWTILVY